MVKVIFSDFDETLIDYKNNYKFSNYDYDVLKRLKNKGILFCIVTGRPISFFYKFDNLLKNVDYIISSNGASIYDVKNKKVIYNNCIDINSAFSIIDFCNRENIKYFINSGIDRYTNGDNLNNCLYFEQIVMKYDNFKDDIVNEILKLDNKIKISNKVYDGINISIDIDCVTVSKGRGIYYLCKELNISFDDCICFGDSKNDISMFNVIDSSYCVGNGDYDLKMLSYKVIDSCYDDGVFEYIDKNII